jgi:mRNA-degrading endonuclease YafQ of YafQ-DinJ toxin-antitoxin module
MKCRYNKYCKHGGEVPKEEAIKEGNSYYHKDCYKEKENKQKTKDLYKKYYKSNEGEQILNKVIHQLIHEKNQDSEYVLFTLCQAIRLKKPMKNIFALHYLINDTEILQKYKEHLRQNTIINFDNTSISNENNFAYKPQQQKQWTDILFD